MYIQNAHFNISYGRNIAFTFIYNISYGKNIAFTFIYYHTAGRSVQRLINTLCGKSWCHLGGVLGDELEMYFCISPPTVRLTHFLVRLPDTFFSLFKLIFDRSIIHRICSHHADGQIIYVWLSKHTNTFFSMIHKNVMCVWAAETCLCVPKSNLHQTFQCLYFFLPHNPPFGPSAEFSECRV